MFDFLFLMVLIGIAAAKISHILIKRERKEHEERMAILKDNFKFQKRILSSTKKSLATTVVGGATTIFLLDQFIDDNNLDQETIAQMQAMDLHQLQGFAIENNFMAEDEMNHLVDEFDPFDPYDSPGIDLVVDEHYHGIDHALSDHHSHGDFGDFP